MYFDMGKARTQAVFSLAILLASCACSFALDPSLDVSQYAHTTWRVRDGFSKGIVTSLAQTPDGYLWVGTELGLLRFDGVRPAPWHPPPGQQLPGTQITNLIAARDGTLWIATLTGLASWKDGTLKEVPELADQFVTSILEARDGAVWIGTYQNSPPGGKLCDIKNGVAHCEALAVGSEALYEDSKGTLWVGLQNGFWRWKPGTAKFFPIPDDNFGVTSFAEDEQGQLLFGSYAGIRRVLDDRVEPYSSSASEYRWPVERMFRDHDGSLWLGTSEHGVVHIHENGRTDVFSHLDGLSGDSIRRFLEDREGSMWVATLDGIDLFREYAVSTISTKQGLSNAAAVSVLPARDGSIWISTLGGLNHLKDDTISLVGSQGGIPKSDGKLDGQQPIGPLFQDSRGQILVSTGNGFGYLQNGRYLPIAGISSRSTPRAISEGPPGHLWVSTQWAGLFHLFQGHVTQQIPWAGVGRNDFAQVIATDPSQRGLWLGFHQGGVAFLNDGAIHQSYSEGNGLGKGTVTDLRFGADGALWAATDGGLSRIKDGHVTTLSGKNALPCDKVVATIEDNDHSIWLNLACGLVRIAQAELDAWIADPNRVLKTTIFDTSDGVRSHAAGGGFQPLMTKSGDGRIWFLPWDGVSVIDPRHLPFNKIPPPVHIDKIIADDKTYDLSSGVRLPSGVRNLTIDYTALSLVVPEKIHFRYKLEGQDGDWREVVNHREVQYTNLPPKHYRFRVFACNNSGVWNEEGAALDFVIPPAWYQTNWFRAACVALFLAMIWGLHELRVRQLAHEFNMGLEQRVAERTRVARDLHDTLLQSVQALLPSLQAGINMLATRPADARKVLEDTADHASQAIAEGRDAVQGLRMSTFEKNDLALAIRTVGEELASAASTEPSPNFDVVVEGASRNLHPILRDEVYRLATEALRNAFRHAAAQNIEVEIRYDDKYFRLRVRDDGKGIPSDVLSGREGHYGLPGMRERAKLVGGKLAIWTEVDGGTEIELTIPGARAYVKSTRTFWNFGKRSATDTDEKEPIERE
jgi:signal transduction histidine kinase/ligand-binding sensor domain-containing protein